LLSTPAASAAPASSGPTCGLPDDAYCDLFNGAVPGPPGMRSGQLGPVWGVSRVSGLDDPAQSEYDNWAGVNFGTTNDATSGSTICGTIAPVEADKDIVMCDGQAVESVNDNGTQTVLAMYPRQPFNFAGRTGTVAFSVSDNTQGAHGAFPAFAITDQPVPAPYSHATGIDDTARNSVGLTLDGVCRVGGCQSSSGVTVTGSNYPPGSDINAKGFRCVTVGSMYETVNYQLTVLPLDVDGCLLPSKALGSDDVFHVLISSSGIEVYGSDPGKPSDLRLIAHSDFSPPLTQGLVWIEDVHNNGDQFGAQQSNSFSWGSFAFDGPVLPRDLGFDVPDNHAATGTAANGLPTENLGYNIPYQQSLSIMVKDVKGVKTATGALLVFNYFPETEQSIDVSVNGNAPLSFAWPGTSAGNAQTAAISVPLSDVLLGKNTLVFSDPDNTNTSGVDIANIDLIAQGAGGTVTP
jgi:hypothetical protein